MFKFRNTQFIDELTGTEIFPSQTLRREDGSGYVLVSADIGALSVVVRIVTFDVNQRASPPQTVRLYVHFLHPAFLFKRTIFIPS
jgi:hypothetical protein